MSEKKHYFCRFSRLFAFDLLTLFVFFWPFVFGFFLCWLLSYFFVLLFHKSSFYVLDVVSCCFLVSLVLLFIIFWLYFVFCLGFCSLFWEGLRVR